MLNLDQIQESIETIDRGLIASQQSHKKLMPLANDVVLKYKHSVIAKLQAAFKESQSNPERIKKALTQILSENWQLVQGTLCGYTALPQDEVTLLLCDIAELCAEDEKKAPIELLMPGLQTESISNLYEDLNTLPLKTVLRTHITSDNCRYLVPVKLLIVPASNELPESNPYYDFSSSENPSITVEERRRLEQHSVETQTLSRIQGGLNELKEDTKGLLGQLVQLQRALHLQRQLAYDAIVNFYAYWELLPKDTQENIPEPLLGQIQSLKDQSTPSEGLAQLCMSGFSQRLLSAILSNQDALAAIQPHDTEKAARISNLCNEKQRAKETLEKTLENPSYQGKEKAGATVALLKTLGAKIRLESFDNILEFVEITTADNIAAISSDSDIFSFPRDLVFVLAYPDNLVRLFSHISEEKYRAVTPLIPPLFLKAQRFGDVLKYLNEKQRTAVYEAMQEKLPDLIATAQDFRDVLEYLNEEQRTAVYEATQEKLQDLITTAQDFRDVLKYLNEKQRTAVYEAMQEKLPGLITTAQDFRDVLEYLNEEQRTAVYEATREKLPDLITTAQDFMDVVLYLNEEQRTAVCKATHGKLSNLISDVWDFKNVVFHLNEEQRTMVYKVTREKLPKVINDATGFYVVSLFLKKEERTEVHDAMQQKLPKLTQDFREVLHDLNKKQRTVARKEGTEKVPSPFN